MLYTPYKKFLENHAPGIQKLTNKSTRFKWYIVGGSRVQANASRSQYKTSVHEESSIKHMKNSSILHSSKKNQVYSTLASHVHTAANHITRQKHYMGYMARSTLSSSPYYLILIKVSVTLVHIAI